MLRLEFLEPHGLDRTEFAARIGVLSAQVDALVDGGALTTEMALRLARFFGTSPEFWLNGQRQWDLWHALRSPAFHEIAEIEPLPVLVEA